MRNVSVDNLSPTPTLADPGSNLSGTISLTASSDPDTTQVDFERRQAGGGSWVTIASDATTPWGTSLDTTALADGLYDFRAIATDGTGHTGTSPIRANVRIDNTAPAGSLTAPAAGATVGGTSVTLSGSYSDGDSGVASVRYELRPDRRRLLDNDRDRHGRPVQRDLGRDDRLVRKLRPAARDHRQRRQHLHGRERAPSRST